MIRASRAVMALALVLAVWCESAIAAQAHGALRVKRAEIVDYHGFERPLVASTILVPAPWQVEGVVVWNPQGATCGNGYNFDWRATSPDGSFGVQILPMEQWQWSSWAMSAPGGCPSARITSVRQYIEWRLGRTRPGARILDFRRRPDMEQEPRPFNRTTPMPMGEMRSWVQAGEALIAYRQGGVDMRETVACVVLFSVMRSAPMMGMPATEYLQGATLPAFAMRAPSGRLDFRLAEMPLSLSARKR